LTGLCVAACRQKRRVRFTTAAGLVNELIEAKHQLQLCRVLARWGRYDLIAIDEVGYVPLAEVGAEFLFQVIAERAERAVVILPTNLPFSEWTQVIPNARLCKALLDGSPIGPTSSRPVVSRIAFDEPWRSGDERRE
jgi:DNA replication protein DnaC